MRASGAISSRIWLISLKLSASMPLVVLTSSLPRSSAATGCSAARRAVDGSTTRISVQACTVAARSVTGSTAGCTLMPLR